MHQLRQLSGVLLLLVVPVIGVVPLQLVIAVVGFSMLGVIRIARSFLGKTDSPSLG
jgi:hypothetical protein